MPNPPRLADSEIQLIQAAVYSPSRHRPLRFWGRTDYLIFDNPTYIPPETTMPHPLPNGLALLRSDEAAFINDLFANEPALVQTLRAMTTRCEQLEGIVSSHTRQLEAMNERLRLLEAGGLAAMQSLDGVVIRAGDRVLVRGDTVAVVPPVTATPVSVPATPATPAPIPAVAAESLGATAPTLDAVRASLNVYVQRFGMERARRLCVEYGHANVISAIPAERRQAVLDAVRDESTVATVAVGSG